MDTGTYVLAVPQQYMNSFLQATGAEVSQYGDVSNQKPRISLHTDATSAQEEGFGWGDKPLAGQIKWGHTMAFQA